MDDIELASRRLTDAVSRFRRRALLRWVIRWTIGIFIILWLFPKYPWLYWTLVGAVPMGLWSLWCIVFETKQLESTFQELAGQLREVNAENREGGLSSSVRNP